MRCPYCAEDIQEAAIVCRFCGAQREGDRWLAPGPRAPVKGRFTMQSAAVLFGLSALFELVGPTAPMVLFGGHRTGAVAVTGHVLYAALFAGLGVGLWVAKRWGYHLLLAGTAFYTADKVAYLLNRSAREAEIARELRSFGGLGELVDPSIVTTATTLTTVLVLLSWWGFALYAYLRRDYFATR